MNSVMENVVESRTSPPFKMKNMKRFKNASTIEEFSIRLKRKLHDAKYLDIKMEHFKKRLIHQHEKPYSYSSDLSKTDDHINDDDDRSISPISQHMPNNNNNKHREEKTHTRIAKKRAVCRGKFRHENMEIFKLGASIPSSLCKTKDPYNVCTEKNLQMSCQNLQQNSKKPEEHLPKEAITNYIINSIEGKGRKDTLQRSLSLNSERNGSNRKLNSNNNTKDTVDLKNFNSGRHILPAIVPEVVSETRRKKMSKSIDDPRKEENDHTKQSAEQSQRKRQSISRRRQTVIGTEKSNTVAEDRQKAVDAPPQIFQPANEIFTSGSSSMNNFPIPSRYQAVPVSENSAFSVARPLPQSLRPTSPTSNTSNSNYSMVYEHPSNTQISGIRDAQDVSQYAANKRSNYLGSDSILNAQQFVPTSSYNVVADTSIPNYHINAASLGVFLSSQNEKTWKLPGNRYENRNLNDANGEKLQEDPINLSVKEQMSKQLSNKRKSSEQRAGSSMPEHLAKTKDDDPSQSNILAFPSIREQISRMGHPNQPPSNNNKELARAKTLEKMSQDIAIKATIDRAKAAMTQPFSLERLFEMNQSYRDLQFYLIKRNVSKILKLAITATINELITYVSYKIFGRRDSLNFRIYSEKIMEVELAPQKPILYDFLNLGISRSEDEVTINAYIKVIRGETSRPTVPSPRVSHQESLGYSLPSFQPRFMPPYAGRRQQDGAMLINHRPYSEKPTNSRPIIPESFRQSQDMLHHFPRPSNDMRVPAPMHHQKPEDLYHTVNGSTPQTHQRVRQTFTNASKEPTRISREDECIDISNDESTVKPVATTRRRRNSSGQDVEELLPPNIIVSKDIFKANGQKQTPLEETRHQNSVSKKDSITKTVIVRDNSMEITKGDRHSKISKKPISEFVLEKIQRPPDKKDEVIKLDIKKEPPEKDSKNSAQEDLQIFKKYLLEEDKAVYKNVMKKVVHEKEAKEKPQVIMIVDDEDMQIHKVRENTAPFSDKSIEPPSQKKFKTNITPKESFVETLVVDDEDHLPTNKGAEDKDLNQNYIPSKNNNAKGIKRVSEPENKSYLNHMPVIEDISSDDEPIQPVQSYRSYGHMTNASAIMESENFPPHSMTRAHSTHSENDAGVKSFTHERPSLATEPRKKPAELNSSNRLKEKQNANVLQFSVDLEPRRQDGSPLSSPSVRFSSPPTNFLISHFPQNEGIHPQNYGSPRCIGALSPAVSKSPAIVESPGSSNPSLPLMQGKYGQHWQAWFSEERKRDFFALDQNPSGSRRQSVETISSVGSDYSPKVTTEQNLVEIKVDSKWYRIKKSLYDQIPKGKLCYIRETNSFLRYFDDNQMEQFIENLDPASETRAFSNFMKQIQERVDSKSNFDTYLGGLEQNEIIALAREPNFSRQDFICDPENYVKEVLKVEQDAPRDFLGFYKFVTGYQIIHNNHPISFQTFLSIHSTNGMKKLFNQYLHNLLGKKVYPNIS